MNCQAVACPSAVRVYIYIYAYTLIRNFLAIDDGDPCCQPLSTTTLPSTPTTVSLYDHYQYQEPIPFPVPRCSVPLHLATSWGPPPSACRGSNDGKTGLVELLVIVGWCWELLIVATAGIVTDNLDGECTKRPRIRRL